MEEETKEEEEKEEEKPEEKSQTVQDTERIRKETEELNKSIAEKENAAARAKVAGVADGASDKEEKHEETAKEYKDKVMSGQA